MALLSETYSILIPLLLVVIALLVLGLLFFIRRNKALVLESESTHFEMAEVQKKADIAAKEADHAKDIFLANISHETRTPMNAIIGLSHILLQSPLDEAQKRDVEKVKHSAEKLLAVTNDMLDISKIKADKLEIESSTIEMNTLISSLAHIIDQSAIEKGLDLLFDTAVDLPESFKGDALHISQVLVNLLNNAIKFTKEGEVCLSIARHNGAEGEQLKFSVSDTGIGLTKEQIGRLFQAFDQVDNNTNRQYEGSGLGLAISKELVERMGGTLIVESSYKNGSTFSFTLPLINPVEPNESVIKRYKRLVNRREFLIFALNSKTANLLKEKLTHYNAIIRIVNTEKELMALLREDFYDALIISPRILKVLQETTLIKKRCDHVILLENTANEPHESDVEIKARLLKPFSTMTMLQTMQDVFTHTINLNPVKEQTFTIDDIASLKGAKILLAEDNEGNAMVVKGLLKGSGVILIVVENGQKAVEAIFDKGNHFDLVLMDINMPVMDGYAATSMVREYEHLDTLPIVAMTANITESDVNKSKQFGMQSHLSKPVDTSKFYKTLLQFIGAKIAAPLNTEHCEPAAIITEEFDQLASLGVNIEDGLLRLNGNISTYKGILKRFAEMFKDVDVEFTTLYNGIKLDEGRELAHNLKGVSGNIGAKEIYRLATDIESCFKGKSVDFSLEVKELALHLKPVIEAIDALEAEEETQDKKAINTNEMVALLKEIYLSSKKRKAIEVKKSFESLLQYAWPSSYKANLKALESSIKAYKFDIIRTEIEKIMQQIKASNGKIQ